MKDSTFPSHDTFTTPDKGAYGTYPSNLTEPAQLGTDLYCGMSFSTLGPDTVIVRSSLGEVVTQLKHDEWFLTQFSYGVADNPHFNFLPFYKECEYRVQNVELCKKIFVIKMFSKSQHSKGPMRLATMHGVQYLLLKMVEFCTENNIKIEDIFSSYQRFISFHTACSDHLKRSLLTLLRTLHNIDVIERGFPMDGQIFPFIQQDRKRYKAKSRQFPIIPSRILLFKYEQYQSYLTDFLEFFPSIKLFLDCAAKDPSYARGNSSYYRNNLKTSFAAGSKPQPAKSRKVNFEQAVCDHGLTMLAQKYNWDRAIGVLSFITCVIHCAKNLIHMFTLMRDHEVKSLSTGCITNVSGWNNEALYVAGITTKLYGSAKPKEWITTSAVLKPVEALEKIQEIMEPYNLNPEKYLIISTAQHPVSNARSSKDGLGRRSFEEFLPTILITDDDIRELEAVDPLRNWRGDHSYKVGMPWRITSHQFRRTMAVFCAQTGLITLPSLKRLLGHLSKIMTLYYTKGCSAQNYHFSLVNPQLAKELKAAAAEANGAMFIREALHSAEKLYGMRGRTIMEATSSNVWMEGSLKQTLDSAKRGLLAWTDSPLGGCGSAKPCTYRAHGNVFHCSGCRDLVGKKSVMDETRQVMEYDLSQLDPSSIEFRAEKQNLEDFIGLCETIIAKSA